MQFISASLGVECDFCHVEGAFEKDDKKPKQTARKMMQMMFAINKDNFEGHREVTCFSCHRGANNPLRTPVIASEETPPEKARRDQAKPAADHISEVSADLILEKYVAALGGGDAIRRVTSRVEKGTAIVGGRQIPIDVFAKAPDKRASVMHMPNGESITAYDGQGGWLSNPGRPVRKMNNSEAAAARLDADLYLPVRLKEVFGELSGKPAEKIADRDVNVVVGVREDKPPVRFYFDQQSGLLVRMLRYAETALGLNPTQIDYSDYRDQDGVKIPFRWAIARPGGRFTIQVEQIQQNVPVDDSKFVPPPSSPVPEKSLSQ
jgi:photosynthetic reaction center cytochrome c subunit